MADKRPTIELVPMLQPAPKKTTYSVKRAATNNEQSLFVERPGIPLHVDRKPAKPRWQVEIAERVTLRSSEGTQVELDLDEACRIAEQILRNR